MDPQLAGVQQTLGYLTLQFVTNVVSYRSSVFNYDGLIASSLFHMINNTVNMNYFSRLARRDFFHYSLELHKKIK